MKYFSMFSGIGGFELGIQKATKGKWKCVGYSEIDKHAIKTYETHFPDHKNYGDATKINTDDLPDFDLLCGGFPCQSFSIAGKRLGFQDTRGTLFFDIARIVKAKKPQIVFLENVKGLLSHDNGRTFAVILATFDELGYNVEWEVINSKYFGVAQNRERVFIIGHIRGGRSRQVFPLGQSYEESDSSFREAQEEGKRLCSPCINAGYGKVRGGGELFIKPTIKAKFQKTVYSTNGVSPTVRDGHGDVIRIIDGQRVYDTDCGRIKIYQRGKHQQDTVYKIDGIMGSLPAGTHGSTPHLTKIKLNRRIRKLTPVECERLQGFPDGWTVGSDTQRYKQCGNAVTVNVVEEIVKKLNCGDKE